MKASKNFSARWRINFTFALLHNQRGSINELPLAKVFSLSVIQVGFSSAGEAENLNRLMLFARLPPKPSAS
jgi:hypothetical protein